MAQFDVYKNENPNTNTEVPFLLDIQNDILKSLSTRIVIPLAINKKIVQGLNKELTVNNQKVIMITSQMGAVHITELKTKITSLSNEKEEIKSALDFLIYGF